MRDRGDVAVVTRVMFALALAACSSVKVADPIIRHRTGPAAQRSIVRVVALPPTCGSYAIDGVHMKGSDETRLAPTGCPRDGIDAADQVIRSALAFRGFNVIDAETVNAVTASRRETIVSEHRVTRQISPYESTTIHADTTTTTDTVGARFEDAPPIDQQVILVDLRADAVMSTRLWIGASPGTSQRRTVVAQVQLTAASDRALVWSRRCELEINSLLPSDNITLERAARCAIDGPHARGLR